MKAKLLLILCFTVSLLNAQPVLQATIFSSGFISPLAVTNCGDSRLFVVERLGKIKVVDTVGVVNPTPFLDIDSIVNNGDDERGLLGVAFDPAYQTNGYFYVYFIDNSGNSQIARYSRDPADPDHALAASKQTVLSVTQPAGFTNHKGGNLVFGPDGYLYCGFGDGGSSGDPLNNGQNDQTLLGKLIRIDVSTLPYTIPASNPYISSAPLDEIWASGLRNPWRYSFDRITSDLWIGDVGQGNWEEVNFTAAASTGGENYGWRCYEGNAVYNSSGCSGSSAYDFPVYVYPHSGANSGCSITGGFVYRGTKYASLFGNYIFSDYCSGNIWGLDAAYNFTNYGSFGFGISSFGENVLGELYFTNVANGNLYSISTNECQPVAYITNSDTTFLCTTPVTLQALEGSGFTYQWLRNNFPIPGATTSSYTPNVASNYQVVVTNQGGCSTTSTGKIVINNKPAAVITGDVDFCTGETALLNANQGTGFTYQWKRNNVIIPAATLADYTATQPGNYRVLVTNANGCTRLANPFKVTGPPSAGTILQGSNNICIGDSVQIVAKATGSNYTYQWLKNFDPNPIGTDPGYYITSTGFYKVTVTNQYGCSKTGSGKAVYVTSCLKTADETEWKTYTVLSVDGKLVKTGKMETGIADLNSYLKNISPELNGFYFIRLLGTNDSEQKIIKFIF